MAIVVTPPVLRPTQGRAFLSPIGIDQFLGPGSQMLPLESGMLWTFRANTTTLMPTFTDSTIGTANPDPIILNARGEPPNEIWLLSGVPYKFVLQDKNGVTIWTYDNISGINDPGFVSEWTPTFATTYISPTSFSIPGDQTSSGLADEGRRMKFTIASGNVFGVIASASFDGTKTTYTMQMTSGVLDTTLSAAWYGLLSATHTSAPVWGSQELGDTLASAATTKIWEAGCDFLHVSGIVNITSFGTAPRSGIEMTIVFDSTPKISNGASLICPNGQDLTVAAGDAIRVRAESLTTHRIVEYMNGFALDPTQSVGYSEFIVVREKHITGAFSVATAVNSAFVGSTMRSSLKCVITGAAFRIGSGGSAAGTNSTQISRINAGGTVSVWQVLTQLFSAGASGASAGKNTWDMSLASVMTLASIGEAGVLIGQAASLDKIPVLSDIVWRYKVLP